MDTPTGPTSLRTDSRTAVPKSNTTPKMSTPPTLFAWSHRRQTTDSRRRFASPQRRSAVSTTEWNPRRFVGGSTSMQTRTQTRAPTRHPQSRLSVGSVAPWMDNTRPPSPTPMSTSSSMSMPVSTSSVSPSVLVRTSPVLNSNVNPRASTAGIMTNRWSRLGVMSGGLR